MKPLKSLIHRLSAAMPMAFFALAIVFLGFALWMAGARAAQAEPAPNANVESASVPPATQAVTLSARCDGGVVVFSIFNAVKRWDALGLVQIVNAQTNDVLRERRLVMGQGQTASFRVAQADIGSGGGVAAAYRLLVTLPDRGMIYVKTFDAVCPGP